MKQEQDCLYFTLDGGSPFKDDDRSSPFVIFCFCFNKND